MKTTIGLIDYGVGNLFSVENALRGLKCNVVTANTPETLSGIDKIILPGVGAFPDGMNSLDRLGFSEFLKDYVEKGGLLMGICLGMQLILSESYEGERTSGLGLVAGVVEPIKASTACRVPHMGWNDIEGNPGSNIELFDGIEPGSSFYFVHSYHAVLKEEVGVAFTNYCSNNLVAAFQKNKVFGVQFHPEKSQKAGLKLLGNFIQMDA